MGRPLREASDRKSEVGPLRAKQSDMGTDRATKHPWEKRKSWRDEAYRDWLETEGSLCPPGNGEYVAGDDIG